MPDVRRQGCGAPGGAPGGEVAPVAGVGLPGRQRLLRLGVGHGGVDLGGGQRAGQRQVERDQVVHRAVSSGPGIGVIRRSV